MKRLRPAAAATTLIADQTETGTGGRRRGHRRPPLGEEKDRVAAAPAAMRALRFRLRMPSQRTSLLAILRFMLLNQVAEGRDPLLPTTATATAIPRLETTMFMSPLLVKLPSPPSLLLLRVLLPWLLLQLSRPPRVIVDSVPRVTLGSVINLFLVQNAPKPSTRSALVVSASRSPSRASRRGPTATVTSPNISQIGFVRIALMPN
jgi:hypothetical protein